MKSYLIFLPVFFFAVLQGAFLQINFVLLLVLFWAISQPVKESLWSAFLVGLFLDLAKGLPLGLSSLGLLITCYFLRIYSRRFNPSHPLFLPLFGFLADSAYRWLTYHQPAWFLSLILAIFGFLLRIFMNSFLIGQEENKIKL